MQHRNSTSSRYGFMDSPPHPSSEWAGSTDRALHALGLLPKASPILKPTSLTARAYYRPSQPPTTSVVDQTLQFVASAR